MFDFETDGVFNPNKCSPVQIAAVMVDPVSLDIIPNSELNVNFKPECMEKDPEYEYKTDILDFHAKVKGLFKRKAVRAEWQYLSGTVVAYVHRLSGQVSHES